MLSKMKTLAVVGATVIGLAGSSASAQAITGSLTFNGGSTNYFNPSNGYVPTGYGNSTGTTVQIGSGTEFGFQDGSNRDTADFTSSSLTIRDVTSGSGATPFTMQFTSNVAGLFNNAMFSSNTFLGAFTVANNTLTFNAPLYQQAGTREAVITFSGVTSAIPEAATWAMMMVGMGMVGGAMRRRQKVSTRVSFA